jgi:hypothetical protein
VVQTAGCSRCRWCKVGILLTADTAPNVLWSTNNTQASPWSNQDKTYLGLLHSAPLTSLPYSLMAAVHASARSDVVMMMCGCGVGGARTLSDTMYWLGGFGAAFPGEC